MSRAPKHPTLPQNDDAGQQAARNSQLAEARETYDWTVEVPTLPGVPLAKEVPAEDKPTIAWLFKVLDVALKIVENVIAVKLAGGDDPSEGGASARDRLGEISKSVESIRGKVDKSEDGGLLGKIAAVVGPHLGHHETLMGHITELQDMANTHRHTGSAGATLGDYDALFKAISLPRIASSFMEDDAFSMLRVAGPNPTLIRNIRALPENFPVSNAQYQATMGSADDLDAALADGRVFLQDYAELTVLAAGSWEGLPQFPYAPLALFAVPAAGESLHPVAIQCGQDPADHPIFTPSDDGAGAWGWQMARTTVQVADGNYHELFVHLARTHLVQEAFAVATHRQLATEHPLYALLRPHFEGTLFINNSAAGSLIASGGPIDSIFAGTIVTTQQAAAADRLAFDFYERMVPADLAKRGVGPDSKLANYPYRDDALSVWGAMRGWVEQYVGIYYPNGDSDVTGDTELAGWCTDVIENGLVKGFRPITAKEQLVDVLTMVMWTGSAQHAAVNFPQATYMSYAPAVTGSGWTASPTAQDGHSKPEWLEMMPPLSLAAEQLEVLTLLGSVYYRMLGDYRSNNWPYREWFRDPAVVDNALPRFQEALTEVEAEIDERNRHRRWEYTFLKPSLIPNSINI